MHPAQRTYDPRERELYRRRRLPRMCAPEDTGDPPRSQTHWQMDRQPFHRDPLSQRLKGGRILPEE